MSKTKVITKEDSEKIKEYRKGIKDKYTDRRLRAVQLLGEGIRNKKVAEMVGADKRQVSRWKGIYINGGVEALNRKGGGRNRENMSVEEEEEIINQFNEEAEAGKMIEVSEIRKAYEEKLGRKTHPTYIYTILHRHGWRKVKPRSRHPKKADDEAIEASKKLKQKFRN